MRLPIREAAARIASDPERIRCKQEEAQRNQELEAIRGRLLGERMDQWRRDAFRDWDGREKREVSQAREAQGEAVEARTRAEIAALPEVELRRIEARWKSEELKRQLEDLRPAPRSSSPSPGM